MLFISIRYRIREEKVSKRFHELFKSRDNYVDTFRGDTFFTMIWSVSAHWIFAVTMWIMLKVLHLPPLTGWVTVIGIFLFFCVILFFRFRSGHWTRINVIGEMNADTE